ncbi:2-oxo-tetronate isomerase [Curvivirga aplysinae]|uniref:2-oxo-tetronate isomerase n=1 Tax=Curvivirga aplysinae TaxID=2529852 RepID=UPI0012BC5DD5|nr:2-oxo-tetronate isomerase [Curvivirga aplysinae]MTI09440.1 hydroxypyruvate isomerase family protein [Curvivirga aplysinae]
MPKFAANLTMMFNEYAFLDRFAAARNAGFQAVEFLFPYDYPKDEVADALQHSGLELSLFNVYAGDWQAGERGLAGIPSERGRFIEALDQAMDYATALKCEKLHVMAGLVSRNATMEEQDKCLVSNLKYAAEIAREVDITLLIEPLNNRDVPGYFLQYSSQARDILRKVDASNVKYQLDIYHLQIMEGDLERHILGLADITGHIQIANVPMRSEPDHGEINYNYIFDLIDQSGYEGFVGCEYKPLGKTEDGLEWLSSYIY